MAKTRRCCSVCHQPGHRANRCPQGKGASASREIDPRATDRAVAQLVELAREVGNIEGQMALEKAMGEVLEISRQMRLDLIKSRAANARLRARLIDQAEAKMLARLDREEHVASKSAETE